MVLCLKIRLKPVAFMRTVFASVFVLLVLLTVWAVHSKPPPAPPGRVMLTWVTDNNPARQEQMRLFRDFCRRKGRPDIDIRLDPSNSGIDKIVVQSVGGVGPDLFDIYQRDQLISYHDAGILLDVTDVAERRGFGLRKMWPALREAASINGRQVSVPTNCSPIALFYNKDLFDRLGVPYPRDDWTWEAFVDTAKRLTRKRPGGRGYASFGVMALSLEDCIWTAGGHVFNENATRCTLDEPGAIRGARLYHDLQYVHHVMPTAAEENAMSSSGGWGTGTLNYFMGGHIGMLASGRFAMIQWRNTPGLRVGVVPMPRDRVRVNKLAWRSTGINRNSPHIEEALLFLEFLASPEYGMQIHSSADGIAAFPLDPHIPGYPNDPRYPDETQNALWLEQMAYARDSELTPLASPFVTQRILENTRELIRTGQQSPEQAMRDAAREINRLISINVSRDPVIRKRYEDIDKVTSTPRLPGAKP